MSGVSAEQYHPGLEGVIASETAIANIEGRDGAGGLEYRGYRIEELAGHVSYEETAFLLLHGDLPNRNQLRDFDGGFGSRGRFRRHSSGCLNRFLSTSIPWMHCAVRSVCSRILTRTSMHLRPTTRPTCVRPNGCSRRWRRRSRIASGSPIGLPIVAPRDDLDYAANFLNMVNGKVPSSTMREAFDLSLVLYAEHELNASTFSARVTVSTLSDIYSGIVAAIGTLKGPLHGGANEEAWKMLEQVSAPENAERWIQDALARKARIMGFGHRVYKTGDPRAAIVKQYCSELAREVGDDRWERIAEPIERAVTTQKHLPPNVDWPTARLYHYMGLETDIYTPIFAMARLAGWAAHIIEQLDHNRLMRPRASYIGPPHRSVQPIDQR